MTARFFIALLAVACTCGLVVAEKPQPKKQNKKPQAAKTAAAAKPKKKGNPKQKPQAKPKAAPAKAPAHKQNDDSARVDQLIGKKLREEKLEPNRLAHDDVFVRRVYLDVIGRIPTKRESLEFIESKAPDKRAKLIDALLESDGYVSHFYNYWADLLRARTALNGNNRSRSAGYAYERWIKNAIRENKPYDEMVRELITASGDSWDNGAIGYYIRDYGMPLDNLAITTQVFLGTQIVCAQCHDHPFDKWTQMDYYHLSAFTYGMQTTSRPENQAAALNFAERKVKKFGKQKEQDTRKAFSEILLPVRFNKVKVTERNLRLPHDYQYDDAKPKAVVKPASIMGPEAAVSEAEPPIEAFADWLTSRENPRFTTVIANRLWKEAFGIGLIEPVDDLKDHTQASNPELMTFLEQKMRDYDYDMKRYFRMILNTRAYQRESSLEEVPLGAPYHFPGPILRRMSAEQIWDSVVAMTIPQPDKPHQGHELSMEEAITRVQLIAESVYDQKPGEFLRSAFSVSRLQKELSAEIEAAQKKLETARENDDDEAAQEAVEEVRAIRRKLYYGVENQVYRKGLSEKVKLVAMNDKETPEETSAFLNELATALADESGDADPLSSMEKVGGEGGGFIDDLTDLVMSEKRKKYRTYLQKREDREKENWKINNPQARKAYKAFENIRKQMRRAF